MKRNQEIYGATPFFVLLLTVLLVYGISRPILTIIGFLCTMLFCLFGNKEKTLYLLLYLVPFAGIFKLNATSTSLFTYLEITAVVRLFFEKRELNKNRLLLVSLFSLYAAMGCGSNVDLLMKQVLLVLLIDIYMCYCSPSLEGISVYFAFGLIAASLVATIFNGNPILSAYISYERVYEISISDVYRFSALDSDPNYFSSQIILALSCFGVLYSQKRVSVLLFFLVSSVLIYFGALSASKTFLILLVIWSGYMLISLLRERKYATFLLAVIGGAIVVSQILSGDSRMFISTIARFSSSGGNVRKLTTGRTEILMNYVQYIIENPFVLLFGVGVGAPYLYSHAAHNTYIDFLYFYGIIGTGLFLAILKTTAKSKVQESINQYRVKLGKKVVYMLPVTCLIVEYFSLSAMKWFDFPFSLIIALTFMRSLPEKLIEGE